MNNEKLETIKSSLDKIQSRDYSHEELGTANGFHEAENNKREFAAWASGIIDNTERYATKIDELAINETVNLLEQHVNAVETTLNHIENLVAEGTHNPNYPKQREQHTQGLKNQTIAAKRKLRTLELEIRICQMAEKIGEFNFIEKIKSEADNELKRAAAAADKAQKAASNAEKVLDAAQNKTISNQIQESASHFGDLHQHHKKYELNWLVAFVVSSLAVIVSVWYAFSINIPDTITSSSIVALLKRLIIISVPSVFMKLALSKYNAERSLRIIYAHREKVLEQYKSFEAGIGDDADAKNSFRIEVARYIFSDPQSNYANGNNNNSSEININPILSTVEKVASKK